MKEILIKFLTQLATRGLDFNMTSKDRAFTLYDDSTGQRDCCLEHYSYNTDKCTGIFKVKRKMSFTNAGDESKDGAVLMVIYVDNIDPVTISLAANKIEFGGFIITTSEPVLI